MTASANPDFAARFPAAAAALPTGPLHTKLIRDETGRAIDIDLGQGRLYNGDGVKIAADQVERFEMRPLRFFLNDLGGANIGSAVSARMRDRLLGSLSDMDITALPDKPDYEGTFLVILGVGLGHHLAGLIETTKARHVLIVEPVAEFMAHAMETVDWPALFERAQARDLTLEVTLSATPEDIVDAVKVLIAQVGEPFIDGAYVFLHYPSWALTETRDRLQLVVDQIFISKGFYEDELLMMTNAVGNMVHHHYRVIDAKPKLARKETAIIVGSGPSIDRSLDDLKRLQHDGIVFSAGTGLRVCLRNGIRPDFHCELENGEATFEVLSALAREFDLTGIKLIASMTVDPRVPALFGEKYLFFRDSVSSTRILAPPRHELRGAAPTCVNTAVRLAAALGFTEMVLFGTDCGTKLGQAKHSKDSIYGTEQKFKAVDAKIQFNQTLPGNFGGSVETHWILSLCARMIGDAAAHLRLNVLNTADGVRLHATTPRLSSTIRRLSHPADRGRLNTDLARITTPFAPGAFLARWPRGVLLGAAEDFFAELLALVDETITEDGDLVSFWRRLGPFMATLDGNYAGTHSVAIGSIRSMPKIGMFFAHRIADRAKRRRLIADFFEEYRAIVCFMRDGTIELLRRLEENLDAAPLTEEMRA